MLDGGRHYEPFERLSKDALDLISGVRLSVLPSLHLLRQLCQQLLRPSPSHRYGDRELRCHAYFCDGHAGQSEFFEIEVRGLG